MGSDHNGYHEIVKYMIERVLRGQLELKKASTLW
jgi:hypothetical protein